MSSTITQQTPASRQSFNHPTTLSANHQTSPHDVKTILYYHKDNEDGSPPEPSYVGKPIIYDRPSVAKEVLVHDIRGSEDQYTLDGQGFQVVKDVSKEKDFLDDDSIKKVYYPEVEELLKRTTGASKIFIFDHTIRRQSNDKTPGAEGAPLRGPVQRVHIDQSYDAGPKRVKHHLPEEADTLLKGRYQVINVWRPIKTIFKDPLGIAAANTVKDDELVPIKLIYPDREGETYAVRPGPTHEWYYLHAQTPEEVVLIKCFDSKTDGRARRVPHSAFVNKEYENEEARESIEVRALVFHPDDTE